MDSASSNYLFTAAPGRRYRWHAAGNGRPTARSRQWGVHCNETLTAPGHERRDVPNVGSAEAGRHRRNSAIHRFGSLTD